jgi:hypothetical protein
MIAGILVIGLVLISTSLRGTQHELGQQLQRDMIGPQGFVTWALAVLGIGMLGYLPGMKQTSRYLLLLVLVVILLRNGSVFQTAVTSLQSASSAGPAPTVPIPQGMGPQQSSSGGTGSAVTGGSGGGGGMDTGTMAELAMLAL